MGGRGELGGRGDLGGELELGGNLVGLVNFTRKVKYKSTNILITSSTLEVFVRKDDKKKIDLFFVHLNDSHIFIHHDTIKFIFCNY